MFLEGFHLKVRLATRVVSVPVLVARGVAQDGIVKLKLTAVFDAQHGGFTTGWSPVS